MQHREPTTSPPDVFPRATTHRRRDARRAAYWNGAVWAVGNGLTSTMLVVYLAMELDTADLALGVSFILAAPHLVGVLRLAAPAMIERLGDRKRFCIATFLAAALVLLGVPWVAVPGWLPSGRVAMIVLVLLWSVYHLLQYLGTVALWSWWADLVPLPIRGRFLGRRERWMVAGQAAAMLAAGAFTWGWRFMHPDQPRWISYAIPAVAGALCMTAAVVPLMSIPRLTLDRTVQASATVSALLAPFRDGRFLRLVAFGCWFSFFNGVTQSAHYIYPAQVLGVTLFGMLALRTGTRVGQFAVSPWMGRLADRLGNRPVMIVSLFLVAQGPLFYFFCTVGPAWWLVGAWVVWIAYAGLNVALPNLMLKLSPRDANTPYIAMYYAVTGLCYAAATIVGGAVSDRCRDMVFHPVGGLVLDFYAAVFLFGWLTRMLGVLVLLSVIEETMTRVARR